MCGWQQDCEKNQVGLLCSESETPSRTLFITVTGQQSLPMRGGCLNLYLLIDLTLGALAAGRLALHNIWLGIQNMRSQKTGILWHLRLKEYFKFGLWCGWALNCPHGDRSGAWQISHPLTCSHLCLWGLRPRLSV